MEEIDLDTLAFDYTGWTARCIGFHRMMIPPGWEDLTDTGQIDWHYPSVLRGVAGSAIDHIRSDRRYGGELFRTQVNGWEFVAASDRIEEGLISDSTFLFYGARRFGDDVILLYEEASFSRVEDPTLPRYRAFYQTLEAVPARPETWGQGFCWQGHVLTGLPDIEYYETHPVFRGPDRDRNDAPLSIYSLYIPCS